LGLFTDKLLISRGIEQKVAPISIIDEKFQDQVGKYKKIKTKAAEVEHAIRHFIEVNYDEDPELYTSFSEALTAILTEFKNNWDEIYKRLEELRNKIKNAEKEPTYGLHRKKQMPFFRILKKEIFESKELSEEEIAKLVNCTQLLFNVIHKEIQLIGFWESIPAQNKLKAEIQDLLISKEFKDLPKVFEKRKQIITRVMELAKTNQDIILYAT